MGNRLSAVLIGLCLAFSTLAFAGPANAADSAAPQNQQRPTISGKPIFDRELKASIGSWTPAPAAAAFQWLRAGAPISGATKSSYRTTTDDLGKRLRVLVTVADADGNTAQSQSQPTKPVAPKELRNRRAPSIRGVQRFTRTVTATTGRWSAKNTRLRYQWMRAGKPIKGARGKRYTFSPADVGKVVRVQVTGNAPGYTETTARSKKTAPVKHRVDVRRVMTYSISTRGRINTSLATFARQLKETLDDPRGWRSGGTAFRRVRSGGAFTAVLAEARTVTSFSSACSTFWSCRVGRYVIINQDRWKYTTPAWQAGKRNVRDYRHMVVNHEVGHRLGRGHRGCPGKGQLAPVMMQQSKGTNGCRFNPWPRGDEL